MSKDFKIDLLIKYDKKSIIEELRRVAKFTGKNSVSSRDLKKYGRVSIDTVIKYFGSLRKALHNAGLEHTRFTKASKEELIEILIDLWEKTLKNNGRKPTKNDFKVFNIPVSYETFKRHFGSWKQALIDAYESIQENNIQTKDDIAENSKIIDKEGRKPLSIRKRFFVLKRDHFACAICGASGYGVRLEVDHRVPISKGGTDSLDNLQTLCFDCNRGKRDSLL